jgi:hypothetical protein
VRGAALRTFQKIATVLLPGFVLFEMHVDGRGCTGARSLQVGANARDVRWARYHR